jgi:uncharacterized membrane protein
MIRPFNDYLNKKNHYCFDNSWTIDAPLELIWNELINYKKWPAWCASLTEIEQLDQFDRLQKGNNIRSVWKGTLPYSIRFDAKIKAYNPYSFLSFNVTGDLSGEGLCRFLSSPDTTTITFTWNVSPTKLWMKMGSSFARPVFMENHNRIIKKAVEGFTQMIEQKSR